jgi:phospholipase C
MPRQEKGIKPSNGLFYQLSANGTWNSGKKTFDVRFEAGNKIFGTKSLGSPFNVYAPGKYLQGEPGSTGFQNLKTWAFAVKAGDHLEANWPVTDFENNVYHLRVYGPNGFFREFRGNEQDPPIVISCDYITSGKDNTRLTGDIRFIFTIPPGIPHPLQIVIRDNAYKHPPIQKILSSKSGRVQKIALPLDLTKQFGWYDFTVQVAGYDLYEQRFAGRVDTGEAGYSDPFMGRVI